MIRGSPIEMTPRSSGVEEIVDGQVRLEPLAEAS
jgi:hypothetical protein